MNEDGHVSISSRGLLAAGLTAAVVGSVGVISMLNAGADEGAPAPATVAAADGDDSSDGLTPPDTELPWGERPHRMRLGQEGSSSAAVAAAGASAARDDSSTRPRAEFGPKGRNYRSGALLRQETNVAPPLPPPVAAEPVPGVSTKEVYYHYAVGRQIAETDGVAASLTIGKPSLAREDWHTLAEVAVQSADGQQVVEVGWTVDRATNGDEDPHLFVFSWVDGGPSCYNECNFVPAKGASIKPGDTLTVGTSKNFGIQHINGVWWVAYDSEWIGGFLDRTWDGGFTRAGQVQLFGEVAASSTKPCSEMGNGNPVESTAAARIGSVVYVNGPPVSLSVKPIGDVYGALKLSERTFRYGGPGAC